MEVTENYTGIYKINPGLITLTENYPSIDESNQEF